MIFDEQLRFASAGMPPREPLFASSGIAATAHPFASETALAVMRAGGNAVDAAIAAAAVLMVVEPRNGHLGGDAFLLVASARDRSVHALNGSGRAPAAATLERYRDGFPADGLLLCTVPGTVALWERALERFGTKSAAELLGPAIRYASEGVPVTPRFNRLLAADAPTYRKYPASAGVFVPGGRVPEIGERFAQPLLARSLERLAAAGLGDFYRGALAREMVAFSAANGGLFAQKDFADHHTDERPPIAIAYRGYDVVEQPPVSQGVIVLIALNILKQFDVRGLGAGTAARYHLLLESLKLAFEERLRSLGDPELHDNRIEHLLSDAHARELAGRIDPARARRRPALVTVQPDTTYAAFADGAGNVVSYIHSLFAGSGVVMGETGVLMNSRMRGFDLDPGSPNVLAPRKRPVHTLNQYIVRRDGVPVLVGGTPGAHWQAQTNVQILTNVLDDGMDPAAAIDAPRFTFGSQIDYDDAPVQLESRAGTEVADELRAMGHAVELVGPWDAGGAVQLIARDPQSGVYRGATEIRRPGCTVAGY